MRSRRRRFRFGFSLPNSRGGAAFVGFLAIGMAAVFGDAIAAEVGRSGDKLLGLATPVLWVAGVGFASAVWLRAYRIEREIALERLRQKGLCLKCNYNLTGNVSGICPECGTPI